MITGKFVQRFSKIIWFPRKLSTCVCVCVCVCACACDEYFASCDGW